MAFVVPAVAAIGGGSVAAGSVVLASAAATAYSGYTAAQEQRRAGRFAQAQSEINAAAEGDAARQREIERKKMLRRALSSQIAQSGAQGIAFEGSTARAAQLDIADAQNDLSVDRANTKTRQRALRAQGQNARISGNAQATTTLLDTAARTLSMFGDLGGKNG